MFNFFKKKKEEEPKKEKPPVEKCCATCKWIREGHYNWFCDNPERPKTTTFNPVTGSKEVYATRVCENVVNQWCKLDFWEGK